MTIETIVNLRLKDGDLTVERQDKLVSIIANGENCLKNSIVIMPLESVDPVIEMLKEIKKLRHVSVLNEVIPLQNQAIVS